MGELWGGQGGGNPLPTPGQLPNPPCATAKVWGHGPVRPRAHVGTRGHRGDGDTTARTGTARSWGAFWGAEGAQFVPTVPLFFFQVSLQCFEAGQGVGAVTPPRSRASPSCLGSARRSPRSPRVLQPNKKKKTPRKKTQQKDTPW